MFLPKIFFFEEILNSNILLIIVFSNFYIIFSNIMVNYNFNKFFLKNFFFYKYNYSLLRGSFLLKTYTITLLIFLINNSLVYFYSDTFWFNHVYVDSFNFKILIMLSLFFYFLLIIFFKNIIILNNNYLNFVSTLYSIYIWIFFMYLSFNLYSFIFILEMLSASIFLFSITSFFNSNLNYKKINISKNNFFYLNLPFYKISSLLYFFWISFITSVNLFLLLILFNSYFLSLDLIFLHYLNYLNYLNLNFYNLITQTFIIFFFNLIIFIKCGLVPFFLWKPNFFKGMSFNFIFFYNSFYFFFLLLFILIFINKNFINILNIFNFTLYSLIIIGFFFIFIIMNNITYLKSFFAVSSIINTLLLFLLLIVDIKDSLVFIF